MYRLELVSEDGIRRRVKKIGVGYSQELTFVLGSGTEIPDKDVDLGPGWYSDSRGDRLPLKI